MHGRPDRPAALLRCIPNDHAFPFDIQRCFAAAHAAVHLRRILSQSRQYRTSPLRLHAAAARTDRRGVVFSFKRCLSRCREPCRLSVGRARRPSACPALVERFRIAVDDGGRDAGIRGLRLAAVGILVLCLESRVGRGRWRHHGAGAGSDPASCAPGPSRHRQRCYLSRHRGWHCGFGNDRAAAAAIRPAYDVARAGPHCRGIDGDYLVSVARRTCCCSG